MGKTRKKKVREKLAGREKEAGKRKGEPLLLFPVSSRFIFVFALSQFSRPEYLGAWNRQAHGCHRNSIHFNQLYLNTVNGSEAGFQTCRKTTRRATSAIWRIFAELNNPKRVYYRTDELNIDGGKYV